jgi:alkylation response protein AidB-like acyl-CoA dehydrogenase
VAPTSLVESTSADFQGGNGYINGEIDSPTIGTAAGIGLIQADYDAGRLLRDSRLYTVGAGTQEIRRMLIGRGFNEVFAKAEGKAIAQ